MRPAIPSFCLAVLCGMLGFGQEPAPAAPAPPYVAPLPKGVTLLPRTPLPASIGPAVTSLQVQAHAGKPQSCSHILLYRPPGQMDQAMVLKVPPNPRERMPVLPVAPPCPQDIRH